MLSKIGILFNATVQFNAEKRYVEFLFNRNINKSINSYNTKPSKTLSKQKYPTTFRGKPLHKWQIVILKAGETAYMNGFTDSKSKTYQG